MKKFCLIVLVFFTFLNIAFAGPNEEKVKQAINRINADVEKMNSLAQQGKIDESLDVLNKLNSFIRTEISWGAVSYDMQLKAKEENPGFSYTLKIELPQQFTNSFYEKRIALCKKHMNLVNDTKEGLQAMKDLNNMDKLYAYLQMAKKSYDAAKDLMEDYSTGNVPKAIYDLYNHSKELYEGVKNIYETYKDEKDIGAFRESVRMVVERAEKSKKKNEYLLWKLNLWKDDIAEYQANMNNILKIKSQVDKKPYKELSFADHDYNWYYGPFQKEVEELCKDFEEYESTCEAFKKAFEEIKNRARKDWGKVGDNITNSKDEKNKERFLSDHKEKWREFEKDVVDPMFKKVYDKYCGAKKEDKTEKPKEQPKKEEQEAVPDYNGLFAGSKVNKKLIPEKKKEIEEIYIEPPKKKEPEKIKSSEKFWELEIPDNAQKEWARMSGMEYDVKYTVNGRTVGYRRYKSSNLKNVKYEVVMDGFGVRHGPYRSFSHSPDNDEQWIGTIKFYRNDKLTGPEINYNRDGSHYRLKYYIDGKEFSQAEYQNKARSDKSLPPYDIYKEDRYHEFSEEEVVSNPPYIPNTDDIPFSELKIPANAVAFVKVSRSSSTIFYHEAYYLPDNEYKEVGERTWKYNSGNYQLIYEEIKLGRKEMQRRWDDSGNLKRLYTKDRTKVLNGFGFQGRSCGLTYKNEDGGKIAYRDLNGKACSKEEYMRLLSKSNVMVHPDEVAALKVVPNVFPGMHKVPADLERDVTSLWVPSGAKPWRINFYNDDRVSVEYVYKGSSVGSQTWWDRSMKMPAHKRLNLYGRPIYSVGWNRDGSFKSGSVAGKIAQYGAMYTVNPDGEIRISYLGQSGERSIQLIKQAYNTVGIKNMPAEDAYRSSNLKMHMNPPAIPNAEMTDSFKKIWKSDVVEADPNIGIDPIDQPNQDEPKDEGDEESYQQLQRQEFFTLAPEIQKIIEKADASFNKKYWEDPNSSRVTMNRTNPKQEALDILRTAIPKVKRAKYRENEAALNHLLAMKFTSYSGRVLGYESKQDFFIEAAQLINRADQLIPQIKHLKSKEDLSDMYCTSAEVWREMTRKALWGDHAYNKMACDKKVMQQYERAVQTDPNNQKARRILEKLKAPKKPVPAKVQEFEKIPDDVWNKAQQERIRLDQEKMFEEATKEPEVHPLEVATMTLNISSGKVYIMHAGTEKWERIMDQSILIFVGDKIKTSEDAKGVSVTYTIDQTFLAILPDSEVEFQESSIMIKRGGSYLQVTKKGSKFVTVTPTYAVGVRGTEFEVKVNDDKSTETYLYEGVVETRNGNDIAYLVPGQKLVAQKGAPILETEEFNAEERKSRQWSGVAQQKRQHQQIVSSMPKKTNKNNNPFAGISAGSKNQGKETFERQPKHDKIVTHDEAQMIRDVTISSSPDKKFHQILVASSIDYGTNYLVARCPVNVVTTKTVTVNWYLNNQNRTMNVGTYQVMPKDSYLDATLSSFGSMLKPGNYRVEFILDGRKIGNGSIRIKTPTKLSLDAAQQQYINALHKMEQAITYMSSGNYAQTKQTVESAMVGLRKAAYSSPSLPDIMAVMKFGEALLALEKVHHYLNQSKLQEAEQWNVIAKANTNWAYERCQDEQFRQTIYQIKIAFE